MGKIIRWVALGLIATILIALFVFSMTRPVDHSNSVWDERTTVGYLDAKNYYVFYTDLACPYCSVFSREIMNHKEEFENDYIIGKDILYEVRMTDTLYEYGEGHLQMSRDSAEAIYCATEEDKFWDYYYGALTALWNDYHSKGIGVSKTAEPIRNLPDDYWVQIGKSIGLGDQFEHCVKNHETLDRVKENTAKAWKQMEGGLPYFKFGNFATSGFSDTWDWEYVKKYLDAGLKR